MSWSRSSGPSGSGKSTALRLIAGLETTAEGRDRDRRRGRHRRRPPGPRRVDGLPELRALSAPERRPQRRLRPQARAGPARARSTVACGKPRLARARRAARSPARRALRRRAPAGGAGARRWSAARGSLLLDEPLSNLDAQLRTETRAEIKRLQRESGITIVYVTHDQSEALSLGDRVAVLDRGRLQQYGPPEEVYDRPANRFVAGFVGNPPMNLVRGGSREARCATGRCGCRCPRVARIRRHRADRRLPARARDGRRPVGGGLRRGARADRDGRPRPGLAPEGGAQRLALAAGVSTPRGEARGGRARRREAVRRETVTAL